MKIEDFADISDCLRGGIFVLLYRGEVVYIGKASRAMLGTISNLRSKNLPSWMPRITFDQVLIRAVHPDQIESVYTSLLAEHHPRHNRDFVPALTRTMERRI